MIRYFCKIKLSNIGGIKLKKIINNNHGITLIALVITIIIIIILCGTTIRVVIGENGLIENVQYSAFEAKIEIFQNKVKNYILSQQLYNNEETENAYLIDDKETMKSILEDVTDEEADKYAVQDNQLKYKTDKVTKQEKDWLEKLGVKPLETSNTYKIKSFEK